MTERMALNFAPEETAHFEERAMETLRREEGRRRAYESVRAKVIIDSLPSNRGDRLEQLDDLLQSIRDALDVAASLGGRRSDAAKILRDLLNLLLIQESSPPPSGTGGHDTDTTRDLTVAETTDTATPPGPRVAAGEPATAPASAAPRDADSARRSSGGAA